MRAGVACSLSPISYDEGTSNPILGSVHVHFELRFEDGVTWLVRVRRENAKTPPPVVRDGMIESEVATLQFLQNKKNLPAPVVHGYALEGDEGNEVGVGYILMEKLHGTRLKWASVSESQRHKVMVGLAKVYIALEQRSSVLMGSLTTPKTDHVGAFSLPELSAIVRNRKRPVGPYCEVDNYYEEAVRHTLNLIVQKERYPAQLLDAFLIHRFLIDLIPLLCPKDEGDLSFGEDFYLLHSERLVEHILVDEHYNITGIIDWHRARFVPGQAAFRLPSGMIDLTDYLTGYPSRYETTFADILEGMGHERLSRCVRNGRLHHLFLSCWGGDNQSGAAYERLFSALRDAASVDFGLSWLEWKDVAMERYEGEYGIETVRYL
jgi:hypothetical protein